MSPILPLIVAIPFFAALLAFFIDKRICHTVALVASAATFALSLLALLLAHFYGLGQFQFTISYIPQLNLSMDFALTQVTMILLVMNAVVFLAASVVGPYFIRERQRIYAIIFLIAEGASYGVFLTGNLLMLYIFWEVAEIMMFFIIFVYGGYNRRYASIKFLIYSIFSSLLLLIGIILLYNNVNPHTFEITTLIASGSTIPEATQLLIAILLIGSFLIKMPVFPLHSWLPDAHTEAPTTGSMILAGVLLKFGGYGLLLTLLILPAVVNYSSSIALLFVFSSVYSSVVALRQANIKRMIAYTSITDMGIVGLGLLASNLLGVQGAVYVMLSHGIVISLLFLVAGTLDELYGTLEIDKIKGVVREFPAVGYLFIFGVFAIVGLPLTAGFIGDILLFFGSFGSFGLMGVVPLVGVLMIGVTLFWAIERSFFSQPRAAATYGSLSESVVASGLILSASAIALGLMPFLFFTLAQ
ncbi:MAG: NADH-quinone oxidoreductase subunit M [Candidatus Micrarchaeota archaeon]|nr:NADH-quinone oxidoreductase subunit M [Candidatus Micrarchaeota archaeon]